MKSVLRICITNIYEIQVTNPRGKELLDVCKLNDFLILNGRTTGDGTGSFTCIANKGRSIVDYFIVSRNMYEHVFEK